ncbi:FAD-dependent oxidoreductase [Pusillimonas sp. TS35]|uniref:NAD(P)/FAD-dependent oxidoreductase n=1 Tax=Paracandidimonas lactea TaxID=2895524 RepID=UPI00136ECCC9|nr:FAD-binding oxidoreductase [Paracandidimonas lactea]MYN14302.1 FAD-dependent oxidoreductase [Pusillimonas sp. TS35]
MMTSTPPAFVSDEHDSFRTSLWQATSTEHCSFPTLRGRKRAHVAIIGGGYTGLSAAITLAENQRDTIVLDAREPGFGASGRNGGQVIPAFKYDPDRLIASYGDTLGQTMLRMIGATADTVFDYIRRYDIQCEPEQGWVQVADTRSGASTLEARFRQWQSRGAPVELWNAARLAAATGTPQYHTGLYFNNAGTVQPLSYAQGLARAAHAAGAQLYSYSPATRISREGPLWQVDTDHGSVLCDMLLIATNGYTTGLWPGLRESLVPVYSMQIATEPLTEPLRRGVLAGVPAVADMRNLVSYFRRDASGRFIFGTRGPFRARPTSQDAQRLTAMARRLYPVLQNVEFPYRWAGRVAMTADHVPHLHQLAPNVFTALGYNGRGVALGTMMGKILASACIHGSIEGLPYPATPLKRIPLHAFHMVGVHAMIAYYKLLDTLKG